MSILGLAFTFFVIINPIGNSPFIASVVRRFDQAQQQRILIRELLFALAIAVFFLFVGESFLTLLGLQTYSIAMCGGILLFVVAYDLVFPKAQLTHPSEETLPDEPFFVPIATPLLSGPGFMTSVMLFSQREPSTLRLGIAIFIAWIATVVIILASPYMDRVLGRRGVVMLEQFMGMILTFISIGLIVDGIVEFWKTV